MSKIKNNTAELQALLIAVNELPSAGASGYDEYDGSYTVIPKVEKQTLDTSQKLMKANVVVEKIPYSEVTNLSNGKTVTIG